MFAMMSSAWDSASEETSVKGNECGVEGPAAQGRATRGGEMGRTCSDLVCGIGGVHQYDAGDIRDDTGARFCRARTAPEGGEGNHVVCV